jgi:hypothetical protein
MELTQPRGALVLIGAAYGHNEEFAIDERHKEQGLIINVETLAKLGRNRNPSLAPAASA